MEWETIKKPYGAVSTAGAGRLTARVIERGDDYGDHCWAVRRDGRTIDVGTEWSLEGAQKAAERALAIAIEAAPAGEPGTGSTRSAKAR